jgi:phosphatidylserine/phosphatidylglycerophosphate/cardiolipin synthase-like enzyme
LEGSPIGGMSKEEKYILNRVADYGGDIRFISSDVERKVYSRYRFNHAKYLVIDNTTTIIESCNWANTGIPVQTNFGNREWGIIIKNVTVARYFSNIFEEDYDIFNCDIFSFDDMKIKVSPDENFEEFCAKGAYFPIFKSQVFHANFSAIPILSPDNSYENIINMINSANKSIFIEQLYIYENWSDSMNPFVKALIDKSSSDLDIKVILNYNPYYFDTNERSLKTKNLLEKNGIEVKFIYSNWSVFSNVHNKGMIVDNRSVLISSINWNENSVTQNRELGIIIECPEVAKYYAEVFFYDWNLNAPKEDIQLFESTADFKNTIYIVIIFTLTFALIARDWRKRQCAVKHMTPLLSRMY